MFGLFRKKKKKVSAPPPATPLTLKVGDIVSYDGADWTVRQKLSYHQGGYQWFDYQLVDGENELWLGAEDDDGLFITIYREVRVEVPEPVPSKWSVEGQAFQLDESGECDVLVESDLSPPRSVRVKYWDFESHDERYLSLENWEGDWDVSIGKEIQEYELTIYPQKREA